MKPLIDWFGRKHTYLRISVTDRCNLRCVYCMPPEGIDLHARDEILSYEEILRLARLLARLGVNKIRLTGGEPLVRKHLPELIGEMSQIEGIQDVGMTTNGILLKKYIHDLKQAGLSRLNISLDTLQPDRFPQIALRHSFENVLEGIQAALDAGFASLKLNVVVMGGINDDEILDFADFVRDTPMTVRFIEYMPFHSNRWNRGKFVDWKAMKSVIGKYYKLVPSSTNGEPSHVAKEFQLGGYSGQVGFITSISEHFCDGCNRLRLLADGSMKSCLFHAPERNLREVIRSGKSDEELERMIRSVVLAKRKEHGSVNDLQQSDQNMVRIGG